MVSALRMVALLAFLSLGALGAPSAVRADDAADAQQLFRRGLDASRAGRWGEAVDAFERSRALVERPSVIQNLAVALARVGRYAAALAEIERYDALPARQKNAAGQAQLEALRAEIQDKVAVVRLTVRPPEAEVSIDGLPLERAEGGAYAQRLDPGRHAVRVSADGYVERSFQLVTSSGASLNEEVTLDAAPPQAAVEPPQVALPGSVEVAPPPAAPGHDVVRIRRMKRASYGLFAGTAALLGPGVYFGLRLKDFYDRCDRNQSAPNCSDDDNIEHRRPFNLFMFSAGVVGATATTLLVVALVKGKKAPAEVALGPSSLSLRVDF